ncbi:hypothetical protein Daura_37165 [Dactylosporangium aurantiacum]|uniref:Lipoprotein n=1 Tax=Dactylosporangium aurantiacum TaxID=35754 RepID=A0A9Q9MJV5_9ACTN|nr:hypothetical protein [Dactylosporangium aurantiacum]MDG6101954.1 hypothetical protein [Dactylosporangium aurantiacum]UWZ52257.1 hypothetical protein Daura_37165 [Dactylosporangium aurantiacum]
MLLPSLVLLALLSGCDAGAPVDRPDATVPTPTWAPAPSATPAGTVVPVGGPPAAVATGPSGTAVALPAALLLLDTAGTQVASVPVTEPVRSVAALPGGGFRAVSGSTVLTAGASGVTSRWPLPAAGGALAVHPSGWTAVALPSLGDVIILSPTGAVTRTLDVGGTPGGLAVTGDLLAVLDPAETSLTVYDATSGTRQEALRAGDGATTVTPGGPGRFVAVDARDGELLVFETGPLILRQRYPVPGTPFAAAYDPTRDTVWVAATQRNEVIGYHLAGGTPREVARHPTPRLPVAVAVDPSTGTLVVAGSAEGLVQRISP